jgi:Cu/Ag efflux protein CusF
MKRHLICTNVALLAIAGVTSFAIGIARPMPALAQDDHAHHGASSPAATTEPTTINGVVTKVDTSAGKVTIKHRPIKRFGLDEGHTMVFLARDPTILKAVKAGDKVKFDADQVNGQFIVTKIEKTK